MFSLMSRIPLYLDCYTCCAVCTCHVCLFDHGWIALNPSAHLPTEHLCFVTSLGSCYLHFVDNWWFLSPNMFILWCFSRFTKMNFLFTKCVCYFCCLICIIKYHRSGITGNILVEKKKSNAHGLIHVWLLVILSLILYMKINWSTYSRVQ